MAVLGAVIAQGLDYRDAFEVFEPGFDLPRERQRRIDAGVGEWIGEADLYSDVRPALSGLRELGVVVGIAGNQPAGAGRRLRALDLPVDFVATSGEWGVRKPQPEFFDRVIEATGVAAEEIVYVGDRIDNDLVPAKAKGLRTVFVKRGPWGWIHRDESEVHSLCDRRIDGLEELVGFVVAANQGSDGTRQDPDRGGARPGSR